MLRRSVVLRGSARIITDRGGDCSMGHVVGVHGHLGESVMLNWTVVYKALTKIQTLFNKTSYFHKFGK